MSLGEVLLSCLSCRACHACSLADLRVRLRSNGFLCCQAGFAVLAVKTIIDTAPGRKHRKADHDHGSIEVFRPARKFRGPPHICRAPMWLILSLREHDKGRDTAQWDARIQKPCCSVIVRIRLRLAYPSALHESLYSGEISADRAISLTSYERLRI